MAVKNQILDLTPVGMRFTVLQTAADTHGQSLDLHWELMPGCNMKDPLIHVHPHAIETYHILEGEMEFYIKDKWITAKTGDQLTVPVGVIHAFRNPSNQVVKVFNTHQPALKMEYYFEDVEKVLNKVTDQKKKKFKMNLNTMLHMGVLMNHYREEIIAKSPPDFAIKILGRIAKFFRIKY